MNLDWSTSFTFRWQSEDGMINWPTDECQTAKFLSDLEDAIVLKDDGNQSLRDIILRIESSHDCN